jgi:hypothetical protein
LVYENSAVKYYINKALVYTSNVSDSLLFYAMFQTDEFSTFTGEVMNSITFAEWAGTIGSIINTIFNIGRAGISFMKGIFKIG